MNITLYQYLALALVVFIIGFLCFVISKQVIKILISIEFMLMGVNINFIAFNSFCNHLNADGYIFALFYIAIGAAELAIALFLFNIMHSYQTSENIEDYGVL